MAQFNRAKTTWPQLAAGVFLKRVELQEWSNECDKRPVCLLWSTKLQIDNGAAQTLVDLNAMVQIGPRPRGHYLQAVCFLNAWNCKSGLMGAINDQFAHFGLQNYKSITVLPKL
jgi:hypothetical protein